MTRILAIVLLLSILGNGGLAWWGVHEHTTAATAAAKARADLAQAQTKAALAAKDAQAKADADQLAQMQQQRDRAIAAIIASKDKADAANALASRLTDRIHWIQSHAKPTDCIRQPVPADLRRVLTQAIGQP